MLPCQLKMIKALKEKDDRSGLLEIDYTGLVYSFLLSVGNDSMWLPVVELSTKNCYDQFTGTNGEIVCDGLKFCYFILLHII